MPALAPDVLERDSSNLHHETTGVSVQWGEAGVPHLVVAEHLLDQQERIRSNVDAAAVVPRRPFECGKQPAVLRDVVGGHANGLAELFDQRSVGPLDSDTEACRSWIPAGAAVDVRDDLLESFGVVREG